MGNQWCSTPDALSTMTRPTVDSDFEISALEQQQLDEYEGIQLIIKQDKKSKKHIDLYADPFIDYTSQDEDLEEYEQQISLEDINKYLQFHLHSNDQYNQQLYKSTRKIHRKKYEILINDDDFNKLFQTHKQVSKRDTRNIIANSYSWAYHSYLQNENDLKKITKQMTQRLFQNHQLLQQSKQDIEDKSDSTEEEFSFIKTMMNKKIKITELKAGFHHKNEEDVPENEEESNKSWHFNIDAALMHDIFHHSRTYDEQNVTPQLFSLASEDNLEVLSEEGLDQKLQELKNISIKESLIKRDYQFQFFDTLNNNKDPVNILTDTKELTNRATQINPEYNEGQMLVYEPYPQIKSNFLQTLQEPLTSEMFEQITDEFKMMRQSSLENLNLNITNNNDGSNHNILSLNDNKSQLIWSSVSSVKEYQSNQNNQSNINDLTLIQEQQNEDKLSHCDNQDNDDTFRLIH